MTLGLCRRTSVNSWTTAASGDFHTVSKNPTSGDRTYSIRITQKSWKVESLYVETFEMVQESSGEILLSHTWYALNEQSRPENS